MKERVIITYTSGRVRKLIAAKRKWISDRVMQCAVDNTGMIVNVPMNSVEDFTIEPLKVEQIKPHECTCKTSGVLGNSCHSVKVKEV